MAILRLVVVREHSHLQAAKSRGSKIYFWLDLEINKTAGSENAREECQVLLDSSQLSSDVNVREVFVTGFWTVYDFRFLCIY